MKPHIRWNEREWEALTREAALIMNEAGTGPKAALRRAQASLPECRRRKNLKNVDQVRLDRIKTVADQNDKGMKQLELPGNVQNANVALGPGDERLDSLTAAINKLDSLTAAIIKLDRLLEDLPNRHVAPVQATGCQTADEAKLIGLQILQKLL